MHTARWISTESKNKNNWKKSWKERAHDCTISHWRVGLWNCWKTKEKPPKNFVDYIALIVIHQSNRRWWINIAISLLSSTTKNVFAAGWRISRLHCSRCVLRQKMYEFAEIPRNFSDWMQFGFCFHWSAGAAPFCTARTTTMRLLCRAFSYRCLCSSLGIRYSSMYCAFSHIGVSPTNKMKNNISTNVLLLLLLDLRGFPAQMRSHSVSRTLLLRIAYLRSSFLILIILFFRW